MNKFCKVMVFLLIVVACFGALSVAVYAENTQSRKIEMWVDKSNISVDSGTKSIDSSGSTPTIYNNRTLVPIRAIIEALGGTVEWNGAENKVVLKLNGITMELWINKSEAKVDGVFKTNDVAPIIINGRTMLPVRFVSENFGANVSWEAKERKITILMSEIPNANNYDITKAVYTDRKIKIYYPQIANLSDTAKEKTINELIKTRALIALKGYENDLDKLTMDIDYEIKLKDQNVLSIQYTGYQNLEGAVHPFHYVSSSTIDLTKVALIKLNELVNIDQSLVSKYRNGKYIPWGLDLGIEGRLNEIMEFVTDEDLKTTFNSDECVFYLTYNSIGISSWIPYVAGSHIEFEIPYKNLGANIKSDNIIFANILKNDVSNSKNAYLYASSIAFYEKYPFVFIETLSPVKLLNGLSKVLGYRINANSVIINENRIDVDLNALSAPIGDSTIISGARMQHQFFDVDSFTECVLDSIAETLRMNFGEEKKVYFTVNGETYNIKEVGITLSSESEYIQHWMNSRWVGKWNYSKTEGNYVCSGNLEISNINENKFDFDLIVVSGNSNSPHNGEIAGTAEVQSASKAVYKNAEGAEIVFDLKDKTIAVNSNDAAHANCGVGVTFNLEYTKK